MRKLLLSMVFVLGTGIMVNANSSVEKINVEKLALEEVGPASDCVKASKEKASAFEIEKISTLTNSIELLSTDLSISLLVGCRGYVNAVITFLYYYSSMGMQELADLEIELLINCFADQE